MVFLKPNAQFLILTIIIQHFAAVNSMLLIDNGIDMNLKELLTDFLTDLEQHTFRKPHYRHAVVLGKDETFLEASRSLLENTPHYIGNRVETTIPELYRNEASLVLVHMDDLSDFELTSIFVRLQGHSSHKLLLLTTGKKLNGKTVTAAMRKTIKMNVDNAAFASLDLISHVIKIHGRTFRTSCRHKFGVINTWVWRKGFLKRRPVFQNGNMRFDLHGCPIIISTIPLPPTMNLRDNEDGSVEMISGLEAQVMKLIAQRLNFVPIVKMPIVNEQWWEAPNGTAYGIIQDVSKGHAQLGIGKIRPTVRRMQYADMTVPYNVECLVWTVPLILQYKHNIASAEFSPSTWAMVITAFVLTYGLGLLVHKMKTGKFRGSWGILNMISVSIGYTVPYQPNGLCSKFLFLIYLNYSRVIIIAYSSSLASILSTTLPEPTIQDEQGILDAGLRVIGAQSLLDLVEEISLLDYKDADLRNRYDVVTSIREGITRIEEHQDVAFIRHYSSISHLMGKFLRAGKSVKFYPLNGCVISYYSVIVTEKGSQLIHTLSEILRRLIESGIISHWKSDDKGIEDAIKKYKHNVGGLFVLKFIFHFYLFWISISLLLFVAELLFYKLRKHTHNCTPSAPVIAN